MSQEGMSLTTAQGVLSAVFQQVNFGLSELWTQLHTDHPGADGTDNLAVNDVRMDCSAAFNTDPDDDGTGLRCQIVNDGVVGEWDTVPATEEYTHVSFWDSEAGGTFVGSGVISADGAVTAGDNFKLDVGDVTASLPIAA